LILERLSDGLEIEFGPQAVPVIGVSHGFGNPAIGKHAIEGTGTDSEDLRDLRTAINAIAVTNPSRRHDSLNLI
jgi:hypothetical protein